VHQRVDILQAFLVNDTRRKIYCKNTLRSQRVKVLFFPQSNLTLKYNRQQMRLVCCTAWEDRLSSM